MTIIERASMTTVGRIDSFLRGSKIKRSSYAHQVPLTTLIKLARQAFEVQSKYLDYSDSKRDSCSQSATANYWFTYPQHNERRFSSVCNFVRKYCPMDVFPESHAMEIFNVLSDLLFSCAILLFHVFLWMSVGSSCLRRSANQLRAFCPQKQHWKNISNKPCCKAGKSARVINKVPLDYLISKVFCYKILLFMKRSFVCK